MDVQFEYSGKVAHLPNDARTKGLLDPVSHEESIHAGTIARKLGVNAISYPSVRGSGRNIIIFHPSGVGSTTIRNDAVSLEWDRSNTVVRTVVR